jgi:hypothetical protein
MCPEPTVPGRKERAKALKNKEKEESKGDGWGVGNEEWGE